MKLRTKIVKGVIWSAIQKWGNQFISFFVFLLLSRLLSPEDFGLVAMAYIFTNFINIFLDLGFNEALIQRVELESDHLNTAFWTGVIAGIVLATTGIFTSGLVANFFHHIQLAPIVRWLSLFFVITSFSNVQRAILRRNFAFKTLATRSLIAGICGGLVAVIMAFSGFGVWSLVAQSLITSLIETILLWQSVSWHPNFSFSKIHFKDLYLFGVHILGSKFVDFFNRRADDLLIGYYLGATALGYYTIGYRLLLIMTRLLTSIPNNVAYPLLSRMQFKPEQLKNSFYKITLYTSLIAFPAFLGISILAPELVLFLFGSKWIPSVPIMQILAFIGVLHSIYYFNGTVLKALGKPSWRLGIMLLNAICNVIGFYLVVKRGIVAIAVTYVLIGYLLSPISFIAIRTMLKFDLIEYLRQYLPPLLGSLAMAITVYGTKLLMNEHIEIQYRLLSYIFIGSLTYVSVIRFTGRTVFQDGIAYIRSALQH